MKKVFFLSDLHLGIDTDLPSKVREKHVVQWLDSIKEEAKEIYDYIIVDTAPTILVTDTMLISQLADSPNPLM